MRIALAACLALAIGCQRQTWSSPEVPFDQIEVARDRIVVRDGKVGMGRFETEATYALVPAHNPTDRDVMVTLRGALVAGGVRRELMPESLRLPAGGERTFALVVRDQVVVPGATAEVEVTGAMVVGYAPPVTIDHGKVYQDQGRAVVVAEVGNTGKGQVKASIMAAFYGADARPMERPFTVVELTGGGRRNIQLVGPVGSKSAQLYVGEVSY